MAAGIISSAFALLTCCTTLVLSQQNGALLPCGDALYRASEVAIQGHIMQDYPIDAVTVHLLSQQFLVSSDQHHPNTEMRRRLLSS